MHADLLLAGKSPALHTTPTFHLDAAAAVTNVALQPAHEKTFFGDNFVRTSGEYASWQALNLHSMTAAEKGGTVHVQVGRASQW
jgi:hypothetical protein